MVGLILLLLLCNIVVQYLKIYHNGLAQNWIRTIFRAFDFNTESNFPTFFSSLVLLSNAVFLYLISRHRAVKYGRLWLFLALVFTFLSLDEMLHIHEHLVNPMRYLFNTSGYLYFAWVIPYALFVLVLGVMCYKLLFHYLPKRTRNLFILAGTLFLFGAIGMELFGAKHAEIYGEGTLSYFYMYTIEETLEMLGSCLFCYALLDYIQSTIKSVEVQFLD